MKKGTNSREVTRREKENEKRVTSLLGDLEVGDLEAGDDLSQVGLYQV